VNRGWRLGRIGGIAIQADPSVLVIGFLVTFNIYSVLSDRLRFPALGGSAAVGLSLLTAVLFIASILAHELAHAVVSKARGIPVRGITLYMLGGATQQAREPDGPLDEFLVTVVGPLSTAALGGLFLLLHHLQSPSFDNPVRLTIGYLAYVNLLIAVFNLLPGFPLDGGRLVLAGVWRLTGDRNRALRAAARVGQAVAILIIAAGFALAVNSGDLLFGLWPAFIGWFLLRAASATLVESQRQKVVDSARVRDVMSAPPPTIDPELSVAVALNTVLDGHEGEAFPVMDRGHVIGFVSPRLARTAPRDGIVREAMVGTENVIEAAPDDRLTSILERMRDLRTQTVLVMDDARLVGVIEREDLTRFFRRRSSVPPRPDIQPTS
jgi:Zn-dependent protease/predicted transcriptional regulator